MSKTAARSGAMVFDLMTETKTAVPVTGAKDTPFKLQEEARENAVDRHHPYGPSRWPALLECPCWEGKGVGEDATKGVRLHAILEQLLKEDSPYDPVDEMELHVVQIAGKIRQMADGAKILSEVTVRLPPPRGYHAHVQDIFGRLDVAWVTGPELHILDLKMVKSPERDNGPQLIAYAAGLLRELRNPAIRCVCLHVASCDNGGISDIGRFDIDHLFSTYEADYIGIDNVAGTPKEERKPTQGGWCSICAHFPCPACMAVAVKAKESLADVAQEGTWNALTPEKKAQNCVLAEFLIKLGEAIKAKAADDCKHGVRIEDPEHGIYYGLQERKGTLRLDVDAVWGLFKETGVGREEFVAVTKVDATKAAAALKAHGMTAREAKVRLEECGARGESSVAFVRKPVPEVAA